MKKSIAVILALLCVISSMFVACSQKDGNGNTTVKGEAGGLEDAGDEFIMQEEEVTDANGETVTNADGEAETTIVYYKKIKDGKKQDTYAMQDQNGNTVKDDKGKDVTIKVDHEKETEDENDSNTNALPTRPTSTTASKTTQTTTKANDNLEETKKEITTLPLKSDKVPSTSETGKKVKFSTDDQQTLKEMLEVPYLYNASYENKDGVPTNIAAHVAMWMANREGLNTTEYASGTIVLDLFKYFAQTVVNFKTNCNTGKDSQSSIKYKPSTDSFTITSFENPTHTISITKIENLGNNNYYKVYANVSGAPSVTKVEAVIQRNQIEATLGFSIKALKWS